MKSVVMAGVTVTHNVVSAFSYHRGKFGLLGRLSVSFRLCKVLGTAASGERELHEQLETILLTLKFE